jgi:hypothetical protein
MLAAHLEAKAWVDAASVARSVTLFTCYSTVPTRTQVCVRLLVNLILQVSFESKH